MRKETDALGEMMLPDDVYYGIQTARNQKVLDITNDTLAMYPSFITAMALVKKSLRSDQQGNRRTGRGKSRRHYPGLRRNGGRQT
ncbi:hypothetical protein LJC26_03010 [Desulfovibrio sp. OttesenSCG-928-O18]|nr:hypothetical protein [Desulfovibrio sp. OttesenSCG-928-O18]MDL2209757.1 hypothetical protein [Desulfovibrio sp. OttesenSCG-928-O18]